MADMNVLKQSYKNLAALGENAYGANFVMMVEGYDDLQFLVQTAQLPECRRNPVETYGPLGVMATLPGTFKTSIEMQVQFKEVITGKARKMLIDWVVNKKLLAVTLALVSEDQTESDPDATYELEDCWPEIEGTDLSVEDGAVLIKPSVTLHAHYFPTTEEPTTVSI